MCYICSCFSWTLDLIQRGITFLLACWMTFAVCLGLIIACAAGVAYGYNYCMAEFMTLTKADVTVYLRRGQFYDSPDIAKPKESARRSGGEVFEGGELTANLTQDYEVGLQKEQPSELRSLSDSWVKVDDTRKYAERLTKYAERQKTENQDQAVDYKRVTPPDYFLVTVSRTTAWHSGSSEKVTRRFGAKDIDNDPPEAPDPSNVERESDESFYRESEEADEKIQPKLTEDTEFVDTHDDPKQTYDRTPTDLKQNEVQFYPMRHRGTTTTNSPVIPHDVETEHIDEDNIVYKPV